MMPGRVAFRMSEVTIRPEQPEDAGAVHRVLDAAFGTAQGSSGSAESVLHGHLQAAGDVLPTLTFVAELRGEVVGQVTCSQGRLGERPAVGLGPIAVAPRVQRQGIGAALMSAVITTADQAGEPVIVLLGDPEYYGFFGFVPAASLGITAVGPWNRPEFMARPLHAWRPELSGPFRYAAAFDRFA